MFNSYEYQIRLFQVELYLLLLPTEGKDKHPLQLSLTLPANLILYFKKPIHIFLYGEHVHLMKMSQTHNSNKCSAAYSLIWKLWNDVNFQVEQQWTYLQSHLLQLLGRLILIIAFLNVPYKWSVPYHNVTFMYFVNNYI